MSWSDEECWQVIDSFWRLNGAACPTCATAFVPKLNMFIGGEWILTADCPRLCGNLKLQRKDDRLLPTFRPWQEQEGKPIITAYLANRRLPCPVDGSRLDFEDTPFAGFVLVSANCRRCGEGWREEIPR